VGGGTTVAGTPSSGSPDDAVRMGTPELRILAGRLPFGDLGIFGLVDAGRVWIPGESSDRWHAAAGGGLWLAWQHRRMNTLSMPRRQEPRAHGHLRPRWLQMF